MKKSLLETNPYLKDPVLRRKLLDRSIISSSAIEEIHVTEEDLQRFREERASKGTKEEPSDCNREDNK